MAVISNEALDVVFREARSHNRWTDAPVSGDQLKELFDLLKFAPTSANGWPLRVVFATSEAAKEAIAERSMEGNRPKIQSAPVVAVLAHDLEFYDRMDVLFPHNQDMPKMYAENAELAEVTAFRNGSLQCAYFMLAARCVGLDCAPMSGFDNEAIDSLYFEGTSIRSNILCALGKGDPAGLFPRLPRPAFDEVCSIV